MHLKDNNIFDKVGIPSSLAWGYLGILIFMMGDGLEQGWLSPYLVEQGLTVQQSGILFTVYGVTIALSSFLSGLFVDAMGPKKAMLTGLIGDKFGWRNTVMWFGCAGSAFFTLFLFYVPQLAAGNIMLTQVIGILWGGCLAGFVPLSAIAPSLVKEEKGAAMSILNLGAGLSAFVGPALVALFIGSLGYAGLTWLFAGLFVAAGIMMIFVTLPDEKKTKTDPNLNSEIVSA